QKGYQPDGVIVIDDFDAAIAHAKTIAGADGAGEVMVIGGGEIFRLAIPVADRLYITHVALAPEGDVTFPQIDPEVWTRTGEVPATASERDEAPYAITIYERR